MGPVFFFFTQPQRQVCNRVNKFGDRVCAKGGGGRGGGRSGKNGVDDWLGMTMRRNVDGSEMKGGRGVGRKRVAAIT